MQIKIYDLKENGLDFKSDFNRFERVRKVVDQRHSSFYWKIDLVTDCTGRQMHGFLSTVLRDKRKEVTNKRYRTKVALTLLTAYSSLMENQH